MMQQKSFAQRPARRRASVANMGSTQRSKTNIFTVKVPGDDGGIDMHASREKLKLALQLREKYKKIDKGQLDPAEKLGNPIALSVEDGIVKVGGVHTTPVPWEEFYDDILKLQAATVDPHCQSACRYRLQVLEEKHNLYKINNSEIEESLDRYRRGGGVFARVTKVDTNIRLAACMNAHQLLTFIQSTVDRSSDDVVQLNLVAGEKKPVTLKEMMANLDIEQSNSISVEGLGLHPPTEKTSHRFDVFDSDLNRAGKPSADLLKVFLTRNTLNEGLYFAEAIRPQFESHNANAEQVGRTYVEAREYCIEITGMQSYSATEKNEWDDLAKWLKRKKLTSDNARFIICFPRVARKRDPSQFEFHHQHLVERLFLPLFLATLAPEDPKNADVAWLLNHIGGFVIQSDEESRESDFTRKMRPPAEVPWAENVCDLWFAYYVWANICSLNAFRKRFSLNTFDLRAVAGENSSQLDQLLYSFLFCDSICSGLALDQEPVLQFLYGAHRLGISMSPLANNALHIPFMENPFPKFFRRGLNVTLATDSPLHYHHSFEPLQEEYGTASKLYKLSGIDMCEIAYNSVMMSSFPDAMKRKWLGDAFEQGPDGNLMELSNVPNSRLELRRDTWEIEKHIVRQAELDGDDITSPTRAKRNAFDANVEYPRVQIEGPDERDDLLRGIAQQLHRCVEQRSHNVWAKTKVWEFKHHRIENAFKRTDNFDEDEWMYKTVDGIIVSHEVHQVPRIPKEMSWYDDFREQVSHIRSLVDNVHAKAFCQRRLQLLEHKFKLHLAVNHSVEAGTTTERASQNRDFYQATKVDTNVRMESGVTARQLLNFIVSKAKNNGDDIVAQQPGKEPQTLRQLLRELNINPETLTVDDLNVQVDTALGVSSEQYTPEGRDVLLNLLLKTDNQMRGRYFAELTKLTFDNFKRDKFTFAENRLPIYGASDKEWEMLSNWFDTHGMASVNNQWMIQIPRIYSYLRKQGRVKNFAQYIENIFSPLWAVSLHPSKHPRLFHFVNHISGFDCVADERTTDTALNMATSKPQEWTSEEEPPYSYYLYHVWANIHTINDFRLKRNFSTFNFRPSCGEAGSVEHLISGYLLANAINYGIKLRDDPVLQYLFYVSQVGVSISPLSNNTKVLDYLDNPLPQFFRRGVNVSLSTDGPLQFHHTHEPLLEEYSIASKVWKFSPNDMCEVARNSVKQSGFDHAFKKNCLGNFYFLSSSRGNDASKTHLSDIRVAYRYETYHTELNLLETLSGSLFKRGMLTDGEEDKIFSEVTAKEKQGDDKREGIITASHDGVNLDKLRNQRTLMLKQIEDLTQNLANLKKTNKQLGEKLQDEVLRDQQAQQLRMSQADDFVTFDIGVEGKGTPASATDEEEEEEEESEESEVEVPAEGSESSVSPHLDEDRLLSPEDVLPGQKTVRRSFVAFQSPNAGSKRSVPTPMEDSKLMGVAEFSVRGEDPRLHRQSVAQQITDLEKEVAEISSKIGGSPRKSRQISSATRNNPMLSRMLAPQVANPSPPAGGPVPPARKSVSTPGRPSQ